MRLIKERITHIPGSESSIWSTGFKDIFQAVVEARSGQDLQSEFVNKFVKEYDEIRYYTFTQLAYVPFLPLPASFTDLSQ
jgi:U3 small nucleolar RNA-associated protein 19